MALDAGVQQGPDAEGDRGDAGGLKQVGCRQLTEAEHEGHAPGRRERATRERKNHVPELAPGAMAVQDGRFQQLAGKDSQGWPENQDAHRAGCGSTAP